MNCPRAEEKIPIYAGGELLGKKARRLERHLEQCPACRKEVAEFRAALSGLRAAARQDQREWPEAEWKSLMTRIKIEPPPRRAVPLGLSRIPAWGYGAATLVLVGLSLFVLRTRLFPPAPVPPEETIASTEVQPGRALEFYDRHFSRLRREIPFPVQEQRRQSVGQEMMIANSAIGKDSQDILSMTLVSQETGLKVHWTLNRDFEWKEEEKR